MGNITRNIDLIVDPNDAYEVWQTALSEGDWSVEYERYIVARGLGKIPFSRNRFPYTLNMKYREEGGVTIEIEADEAYVGQVERRLKAIKEQEAIFREVRGEEETNESLIRQRQENEVKVFISYSSKNSEFAHKLGQDLYLCGLAIWIDKKALRPGESWRDQIEVAVDVGDVIVGIVSPESMSSREVKKELCRAHDLGKIVMPVIYRSPRPRKWYQDRFGELQYVDFQNEYQEPLYLLTDAIYERASGQHNLP